MTPVFGLRCSSPRRGNRAGAVAWSSLVVAMLLAMTGIGGCGESARVLSPPQVTALGPLYLAEPPAGETGTFVAVFLTLMDSEGNSSDLEIAIRRGSGAFVALGEPAAGQLASGGSGVRGLTARPLGFTHRLVWKVPQDLGMDEEVVWRVTPTEPEVREFGIEVPKQVGRSVEGRAFRLSDLLQEPQ